MKEKNKKLLPVYIILGLILLLGASYALFSEILIGEKRYSLSSGGLKVYLDESQTTNSISLTNVLPVSDKDGMANDSYLFSLVNEEEEDLDYTIYLKEEIYEKQTPASAIRYYYSRDIGNISEIRNLEDNVDVNGNYYIETGTIPAGYTYNYEFKMWINYDAGNEIIGTECSLYLEIEATQATLNYYVDASKANYPELTSGMIPVYYDETEKNWKKADLTKEWYDYEKWNWANAVTVTENSRQVYMAADVNTPISMNDINTMWVWIPRYEYQFTDLSTLYAGGTQAQPGEIKVNFINEIQTEPSDASKYKIPAGFTFGNDNLSGFWMGKFETSTLESCTATDSSVNTGCDLATLTPQVKPNVTSWRGARVSTFFEASRLMQDSSNADIYGFDVAGTSSMDSHMLKNSEWGIVAMLSQSKYGKYGNSAYSGTNKEVYQNKSSSYITGMSNETPSSSTSNTQVTYDMEKTGYGASTTGTIYGVYDMSGGSDEYVMGNYNNDSGYSTTNNSGFCGTDGPTDGTCRGWPNIKYYDLYTSTTIADVYKSGDATYETGGYYNDFYDFITSDITWFARSGSFTSSTVAGVFTSGYGNGEAYTNCSSRLAITP